MPKDPHFLQMKNKAERSRFFLLSVALELSFRMFLNASVKDFSYFLGSVGGFGGDFGVILV